ncbi:MAG: class I SAM-dependent methyltransferase [Pseudomonadota bacterium]|nr:class I SAM-dependent methyltransferase [Pseudomonadota bacterium]
MSRLDSVIARLTAQRACLDRVSDAIAGLPGPVLELGLGNGRTYDHLRQNLPGRDIYVFERQVNAHPDCIPPDSHLFLGDFRMTLPAVAARFAGQVALVHADTGTGDKSASLALARLLGPLVIPLMRPGGLLASDQPFEDAALVAIDLPDGVPVGRYHLYKRA